MKLHTFLSRRPQPSAPAEASAPPAQTTTASLGADHVYDQDGLRSFHNHEFMDDPFFQAAYLRGVQAAGGRDYNWHWRVHVGLWAARTAMTLIGDFVECGVGRGFMSSAVMCHLDWNRLSRRFYLLDTFATGIDAKYASEVEQAAFTARNHQVYADSLEEVRQNFSEWPTAQVVVGAVPDTLPEIKADSIAFLHLDMNCRLPEVAALMYLWDRMAPGAPVLFDDYAYRGYREQKLGIDEAAAKIGVPVLSLPTGQGLLFKPVVN